MNLLTARVEKRLIRRLIASLATHGIDIANVGLLVFGKPKTAPGSVKRGIPCDTRFPGRLIRPSRSLNGASRSAPTGPRLPWRRQRSRPAE